MRAIRRIESLAADDSVRIRPRDGQFDGRVQRVLGPRAQISRLPGGLHLGFRRSGALPSGRSRHLRHRPYLRLRRRLQRLRPQRRIVQLQRHHRQRPVAASPCPRGGLSVAVDPHLRHPRGGARRTGEGLQRIFLYRSLALRDAVGGDLQRRVRPVGYPGAPRRSSADDRDAAPGIYPRGAGGSLPRPRKIGYLPRRTLHAQKPRRTASGRYGAGARPNCHRTGAALRPQDRSGNTRRRNDGGDDGIVGNDG